MGEEPLMVCGGRNSCPHESLHLHIGLTRIIYHMLASNGWANVMSTCLFLCLSHYGIWHWVLAAYNGASVVTLFSVGWYSTWGFVSYIRVSDDSERHGLFFTQIIFFIPLLLRLRSYKFLFSSPILIWSSEESHQPRRCPLMSIDMLGCWIASAEVIDKIGIQDRLAIQVFNHPDSSLTFHLCKMIINFM